MVAFTSFFNGSLTKKAQIPANVKMYYSLARGVSGFHSWLDVIHSSDMPDGDIGELRFVLKLNPRVKFKRSLFPFDFPPSRPLLLFLFRFLSTHGFRMTGTVECPIGQIFCLLEAKPLAFLKPGGFWSPPQMRTSRQELFLFVFCFVLPLSEEEIKKENYSSPV